MLTFNIDSGMIKSTKQLKAVARSVIVDFFIPTLVGVRNQNILNMVQTLSFSSLVEPRHSQNSVLTKKLKGKEMRHIFNYNQTKIRTTIINNQPWFCLADCAAALGIKNATTSVKMSDKGVGETHTLTKGGRQKIKIINEPNLYRLIFRSNKPEAQKFANWVYEEVLPQIRQTGEFKAKQQQDLFLPSHKPAMLDFDKISFAQLFKEAQDPDIEKSIMSFSHREFIDATEAIKKFGVLCYDLGTLDAVFNLRAKGRIKGR